MRKSETYTILGYLIRWTILIAPVAAVIGSMVALFLWLLRVAIQFRFEHSWLLYLLPVAGIVIHFIYQSIGKSAEKGNDLIIEQILAESGNVPKRMAPVILVTTIITHLFGGSAGREGTAVQIGGSIAAMFGGWFGLKGRDMRMILTAGIAAGFGAVFGTPVTGAIFAIEILTIGRIRYDALLPALMAAVIGDMTVAAWHVPHTHYHIDQVADSAPYIYGFAGTDILLLGKVILASVAFGLAALFFAVMIHETKTFLHKMFKRGWLIPLAGGITVILLTLLAGKPDYLSLGVEPEYPGAITIQSAFRAGGADVWSWLWKAVFTVVTLGSGFKGGEVTPLFYIGATLGNTLSGLLNAPVSLFAALGFIAVFAGSTNTPLACTFMGVEIFGGEHVLLFAVACFTAYFFSGHSGIYGAQRIGEPKIYDEKLQDISLSEAMKTRGYVYKKFGKYRMQIRPNKK